MLKIWLLVLMYPQGMRSSGSNLCITLTQQPQNSPLVKMCEKSHSFCLKEHFSLKGIHFYIYSK